MSKNFLPTARKDNLVIQDLPDELLVYDLSKNKAFCLNQTARLILEECDGKTTFEQAATNVGKKLKTQVDDQIFWMALGQLKRNGLLDETAPVPEIPKVSRRDLVMSSMAVGISLPTIFALGLPPPTGSVGQCATVGQVCMGDGGAPGTCCNNSGISCTASAPNTGTCCIINTIACNQQNDLCCPGTGCGTNNQCCLTTNPCFSPDGEQGACCPGTVCVMGACEPVP